MQRDSKAWSVSRAALKIGPACAVLHAVVDDVKGLVHLAPAARGLPAMPQVHGRRFVAASHAGLAPRCFGRVAKRAANVYTRAGPVIWDGGSGHLRRSQRVWRIRLRCCSSVVAAAISCRAVPDGPHASLPQDGVNRRNSRCRTTRETAMRFRKQR